MAVKAAEETALTSTNRDEPIANFGGRRSTKDLAARQSQNRIEEDFGATS